MFITKKHISRRTLLRGAGVALALPLLDSMIPAQTSDRKTAANPKTRFTGIFIPHGAAPGWWVPEAGGPGEPKRAPGDKDFKYSMIFEPLEPFREHTVIMSGLWSKSAEPPPGQTGADHWVAAAFLCARQTEEDYGRRHLRWNHHRSDHRAACWTDITASVAATGARRSGREFEQLRRRL